MDEVCYTYSDLCDFLTASDEKGYVRQLEKATERFVRRLDDLEEKGSSIGAKFAKTIMQETVDAIAEIQTACEEFERSVHHERTLIRRAQATFRALTQALFTKTYFNRARLWPQGYQGDYVMLDYLYRNDPSAETSLGYHLNAYLLETTLAVAVRKRKELLCEILRTEIGKKQNAKILDVACGSCQEVLELAEDISASGAQFTLVDYDQDALTFSAERLSHVGLTPPIVDFRHYNALKMVNAERNQMEFGAQDLIYSVGLFDYLKDDVLVRLLKSLYDLLVPDGTLITTFKDCRKYDTFIYHWMINWDGFLQRTESEVMQLFKAAHIPRDAVTVSREQSGVILFFTITKQ